MNDKAFKESVAYVRASSGDGQAYEQPTTLHADSYNKTMANIEQSLGDLYVKTRMLEDIADYTKSFLNNEVMHRKVDLFDLLKNAERQRDSLKRKGYVLREVPLKETRSDYPKRDRDGQEIRGAVTSNQLVSIAGAEITTIPLGAMTNEQEQVSFASNKDDILKGTPYRAFYMLDAPATNGVTEKFTFHFNEKGQYITNVDVETSSCTLSGVRLLDEEGLIEVPQNSKSGFKRHLADGMSFVVTDREYRQVTFEYDAMRMSSDFWDKVGAKELATELGLEYTFNLDAESGMKQYREDYARYQAEVAAWHAASAAVDARNAELRAGYEAEKSSYNEANSSWEKNYGASGSTGSISNQIAVQLGTNLASSGNGGGL